MSQLIFSRILSFRIHLTTINILINLSLKCQVAFTTLILIKSSLKMTVADCWIFLIDNIFRSVWWTYISSDCRHSYQDKLLNPSLRLMSLFVFSSLHKEPSIQKKRKRWLNLFVSRSAIEMMIFQRIILNLLILWTESILLN